MLAVETLIKPIGVSWVATYEQLLVQGVTPLIQGVMAMIVSLMPLIQGVTFEQVLRRHPPQLFWLHHYT
jgi:hypothetical protein